MRGPKIKFSEQQKGYISVLGRFIDDSYLGKEFDVCRSIMFNLKRKLGVKYIKNYEKRLLDANNTYLKTSDDFVKNMIVERIYKPMVKRAIKCDLDLSDFRPLDGYPKLYNSITFFQDKFPKKREISEKEVEKIALNEFLDYIKTNPSHNISKYEYQSKLQKRLIKRLNSEYYSLPEEIKERFDKVLATLTERERTTLRCHFGIGEERRTLEEIGAMFNRTTENARQTESKALRKLRYPPRSRRITGLKDIYLKYLDYSKAPEEGYLKKKGLEDKLNHLVSQFDKDSASLRNIGLKERLSMPIDELEFPVRSRNCIRAANIKTIKDLVQTQERHMLKYRNFGKKSLAEIKKILEEIGLSFGMKA